MCRWRWRWTEYCTVDGRRGRVGQTSVNYGGRKTFTALPRRKASLFFSPFSSGGYQVTYALRMCVVVVYSLLYTIPRGILKVYVTLLSAHIQFIYIYKIYIHSHILRKILERETPPFIPLLLSHSPSPGKKERKKKNNITPSTFTRSDTQWFVNVRKRKTRAKRYAGARVCVLAGYMSKSITH